MYSYRDRPMGMQVHAVPEAERAFDSSGRRLPWGYEFANPPHVEIERSEPVEKGPFGRSMRRSRSGVSRSRSKTAEPKREEDKIRAENIAAEDAVFGSLRRVVVQKDDSKRDTHGEEETHAAAQPAKVLKLEGDQEPTEVLLFGFGGDMQWAAIDFYERVSNGYILEDYDRQPPGSRYDISRSMGRASAQKRLSRAAMRKKNKYAGGEHWIKVTFDSQQAAELATARQPHIIKGHLVYAEPFTGSGPQKDEPIFATQAGAQITSDALPTTLSTHLPPTGSPNSSSTATSATATAPSASRQRTPWGAQDSFSPSNSTSTIAAPATSTTAIAAKAPAQQPTRQGLRVEGATRAVVLPAELAFAPRAPRATWTAWLGGGEIIGAGVPRRDDGAFDWARASLYWRLFYWLDSLLGTDFCGLRGEE